MTVRSGAARAGVPILMYHALTAARTAEFAQWTLSADRLQAHLEYLGQCGYRSVTVAELTELHRRGGLAPGDRLVALTFDDAYADFHAVALPLLARYGLTATLFVPTAYVGGRSGWMRNEDGRAILSWPALAEIAGCGIEIGAHSHTHPELDRLPPGETAVEAGRSKALLEDGLGQPVRSFAYPYGHYDRRVRNAVAAAGYSGACTMNSWAATARDHPLELPRTAVLSDTDVAALAARLAASRGRARRAALRARRAAQMPARRLRTRPRRGAAPAPAAR
jgi:peptidoglycan/xylan/chitin deacetylase (PgdA/CDA1 family)